MTKRLLVMAGGTGGHVFPGLAVAQHLKQLGWQVEWLGTADRMEAHIVPQYGFNINFIKVAGVRGNGVARLLMAPFMVLRALLQAFQLLRRYRPDVVLGMGGYASGPGGIAAWLCGVPLVLHEQNATPGLTNKLLARFARKVLTAFDIPDWQPGAGKKQQVGNPVRAQFSAISEKQKVDGSLRIFISGGSLGARVLNERVPEAIAKLRDKSVEIWHQAGKGNSQNVAQAYSRCGVEQDKIRVADFIDEMTDAFEWADLVICRAGALTVSEVALAGRCAIFVPLPHAVDDHQTKNAEFLVGREAALLLPQPQLEAGQLSNLIEELNSERDRIISISQKARACGEFNATENVAKKCIQEASVKA